MSQLDDLNAKLDAVGTTLDDVASGLTKLKVDLDKTLADLKAQIAAGSSPTDLTATLAKAQGISDKIGPIAAAIGDLDTEAIGADTPPTA